MNTEFGINHMVSHLNLTIYMKELDYPHNRTIQRLNSSQRQSSTFTSHLTDSSDTFQRYKFTACLYWTRCLGLNYATCEDNGDCQNGGQVIYEIAIHQTLSVACEEPI